MHNYITPEGLTVFNAGCNTAKKHEMIPFLACIFFFKIMTKRYCGKKAISQYYFKFLNDYSYL